MKDSIADPRDMPRYSVPEVAAYVRVKPRTLSTWIRGRSYPAAEGAKHDEHRDDADHPSHASRLISLR